MSRNFITEDDIRIKTEVMQEKLELLFYTRLKTGDFYEAEELISMMDIYGYETNELKIDLELAISISQRERKEEVDFENYKELVHA